MIRARRPAWRIATIILLFAARESSGQGLSSASGASLSIVTPTEVDYDAGASLPTANYGITTSCTGTTGAGCRLFIQYGTNPQGQQVDLEYAILSLTVDCLGAVANANTWYAVNPATTVISTNKRPPSTSNRPKTFYARSETFPYLTPTTRSTSLTTKPCRAACSSKTLYCVATQR